MPTIQELHLYLQELFTTDKFSTIDTINGLQVASNNTDKQVQKIAYAVDSSYSTIQKAISTGADMLIVHHGLYWGKVEPIVGVMHQKISSLLQNNVALYAMHLPLDAHMQLGNNRQLAKTLELNNVQEFGEYKGVHIGVQGTLETPTAFNNIHEKLYEKQHLTNSSLEIITTQEEATFSEFKDIGKYIINNQNISKIAIISGGGTRDVLQAYQNNVDLYITGDASHTAWLTAKELEISVLFAGHYFTEIWGVLALGVHLQNTFGIKGVFIYDPTGL